jgi:hypothetical protein
MKIQDLYPDAGRPVAYHPGMKSICGSINAALLYCHLIYWTGKQSDPNGWIYKSAEEISAETSLSYPEQKTARGKLRQRGLLQERYRRSDHTFYFRVNLESFQSSTPDPSCGGLPRPEGGNPAILNDGSLHSRTSEPDVPEHIDPTFPNADITRSRTAGCDVPESHDPTFPNEGFPRSLNGTSESTTESTTESTAGGTSESTSNAPPMPGSTLAWSLAHGLPVSPAQLERERTRDAATAAFEAALGINQWPWCSTRVWERMADLVATAWKENPDIFGEFAEWIKGEAQSTARYIKNIRSYPQEFIDTSWPLFQASRKPREPGPTQVETDLMRRIRERKERQ